MTELKELDGLQMEEMMDFLTQPERAQKNVLKLLEEMAELSEVLLKRLTKNEKNQPPMAKVIEEGGDVMFRLAVLIKQYSIEDEVMSRLEEKSAEVYNYYIEQTENAKTEA